MLTQGFHLDHHLSGEDEENEDPMRDKLQYDACSFWKEKTEEEFVVVNERLAKHGKLPNVCIPRMWNLPFDSWRSIVSSRNRPLPNV